MNTIQDLHRAQAVKAIKIIDTVPEEAYDNITQLAAYICDVPVAMISIIEADKQFNKSIYGSQFEFTSIEYSFCYYAIQQNTDITIIEDTHKNPHFKDNPYVVSKPNISFYAGLPLKTPENIAIGTLSLVDYKPNSLTPKQIESLKSLAGQVEQLLMLRKAKVEAERGKNNLLEKTNRLNNIIHATQMGTWEWNVQTGDIVINDRYAEILGYSKKELKPVTLQTWYKLVHPDDAKLSDELLKKCFNKELEFYEIETRMFHKDGHIVWIHDSGKVVEWTEDGLPLIMIGTHTDITAKKNTELRLQNITNNVPGVVFRYFRNSAGQDKLVQVSKGAEQIWGFNHEEIMDNNLLVWKRIHPDDIKSLVKSIEDAYNNFSYWTHEWRYLHPNGETKWHKGSGNPSKIDKDTIVWDCFTLDITDRKRAENELSHTMMSLKERTKEINCLYEVTRLTQQGLTIKNFLNEVVQIVPQGFKYSELVKVALTYGEAVYKTPGFTKSKYLLENHDKTINNKVLHLVVCYPNSISRKDKEPFFKDETELLKSLTNNILLHINQFESKNQKDLILDTTVEGIYGIDAEGNCTFINPSGAKMLGYSQKEFLGKNLHELIHYKNEDGFPVLEKDCPIYKAVATKKGCVVEDDVFWRKDGSRFPVRYTSTPILVDKKITGAVVVFSDITEKKQSDKQLQTNEKRFKALVQEGSDLISILDRDGIYTYISPTSHRLMGFSSEYLLGKNVKEFVHPDDWQDLSDSFKLLKDQKQISTKPFRYKNNKNEWRWIETTATNLLRDPAIEGIVTNSRDITERIIFEEKLQESNERYNIINKATNDAIYDWDIVNDTFFWGEGFERLFGHNYSDKVFRLKDWNNFTHLQDSIKHKKRWENFFSDKNQSTWKDEFRFLKADGTYAYVEENGVIIRDDQGKPVRMIGALRDKSTSKITEIQQQVEFEVANIFKERQQKLDQTLDEVIKYLVKFTGFETAEIWLTGADNKQLNLYKEYRQNKTAKAFYKEAQEFKKLKKGEGLPGSVWNLNTIQVLDNIDTNEKFYRNQAAKIAGLKSAVGIPLTHNQNTIGVLVFGSKQPAKKLKEEIVLLEPLGTYLGAEIRRKRQEEEIQLFFDNSPEIMAVAAPNGHFVKVNPAFCNILGYTVEELTSTPYTNFLHPDDLVKTEKVIDDVYSGEQFSNNFTNRYRTKSGDYRWISWSSSEIYGEEGYAYAYGRDITELTELQRLFENAAKLAKIGSWELDLRDSASNNNVYWSSMTREVMEVDDLYNPTHSAGLEFCLGEHKRNLSKAVQNLVKTGEPFDLELQILSGKGNLKWVRCIGESERINDKCVKVFGSYQDIDQRKQAELKVKQALAERNNILESIGDAFFAVDLDWHVTYWNHKAEELILVKKEHIIGKNLWDVFSANVGLKAYNEYHKAMKYHEVVNFEYYFRDNSIWLEVSAYPSKTGLSVYFKDITERKKQEESIRESNERFEKITEATNDAIWDFDVSNNHLFWGKGFEVQFGYKLDKITPTLDFLISLIHPDDRNHVASKIQSYMGDGKSTNWFEEYRFKKADGSYAYVIDRAVFIREKSGHVTRVIGAMTDISYRKEHEESLQKLNEKLTRHAKELQISNQELEQFAYVTSHDLQEPLRMISSFLMLLEKKYGDKLDEKAHEYIYYAVDGAKRMKKIILDLLEFSKVGRYDEEKLDVDTQEIVDEYRILRKKIIAEKKVRIHCENLPVLTTYRVPLTQVFHNLLDNAIKYSKEDETPDIIIKATEHRKHWEFSVKDNGIGIESAYFNKIFIIFQRLHNNEMYEGTGMGLAIVKKIIETLEGKIWVTSQRGEGSTFFFTLPKTN